MGYKKLGQKRKKDVSNESEQVKKEGKRVTNGYKTFEKKIYGSSK